jgi:hypothetical protein
MTKIQSILDLFSEIQICHSIDSENVVLNNDFILIIKWH